MTTEKLDNTRWQSYFDSASESLVGKNVEIEVAGLGVGDQIEAEWLPLTGLTYDPKNDLFEVATNALDHLIRQPKEVWIDYSNDGLHSIEVIDTDNNHQIIKFKPPLALPPPT